MIDLLFVYFRTLTLDHLDAAWFTVSKQDFSRVRSVIVLDNNTEDTPQAIQAVLDRYPVPVPRILCFEKHGRTDRTQSWSVNRACGLARELVLLTRADFLLDYDLVARFADQFDQQSHLTGPSVFVTSYCQQMGYDAQLSNTDALADYSQPGAPWRDHPDGPKILTDVPSVPFTQTHLDAGVWLARRHDVEAAGGLNEQMVAWGYQQQEFQRRLAARRVQTVVIPEFLFHHQHHYAVRDFARAGFESRFDRGAL